MTLENGSKELSRVATQAHAEALGVSELTYYRGRNQFGGMNADRCEAFARSWRRRTPG